MVLPYENFLEKKQIMIVFKEDLVAALLRQVFALS